MNLCFTYAGVVESNQDPLKLGRLKIRVPHVYGSTTDSAGYVGINDLPWANPTGMPAGGSDTSGGISFLPAIGDKVNVRFLDGEPEKPIWEWGMQTTDDAKNLKLHEYGEGSPVGLPDRAIITRYGHSLEIKKDTLILTTAQGYQLVLAESTDTSGGEVALNTPAGQSIAMNDLDENIVLQGLDTVALSASSVITNAGDSALIKAAGSFTVMVGQTLITVKDKTIAIATGTGATLLIDDSGNISLMAASGAAVSVDDTSASLTSPTIGLGGITVEDDKISVSASSVVLDASAVAIGTDAQYPAVMLTDELLLWIQTHTHSNGDNGSPTGPPQTIPSDMASTRMQLT